MAALGRFTMVVLAGGVPLLAATRPVTLKDPAADAQPHPYCAVLDAGVFAETAPGLRGLHLMQDGVEIPFLTTVSEPASAQTDVARVLRLKEQDGALSFDLAMSARAYTEIFFKLRMQDFVAVTAISAGNTRVGDFKLFDLSREHLARQTTVQLPEMTEGTLHVVLRAQGKALHADDLEGVDVAPDRAAQSVYTAVATEAVFTSTARETIAELEVPAHVPVQRIRFETTAADFLRRVRVEAWPASDPQDVETISGSISSTHRSGISDTQLVVPMTLGANLQGAARVRVIVENDGQPALAMKSIVLEMREHKICFDAPRDVRLELTESADTAVPNALSQGDWARAGRAVLGEREEATSPRRVDPAPRYPLRWRIAKYAIAVLLAAVLTALALLFSRLLGRQKARG